MLSSTPVWSSLLLLLFFFDRAVSEVSQCPDTSKSGCSAPLWDVRWDMAGSTYLYCFGKCQLDWLANNTHLGLWAGVVGVDHYWTHQGMPCVNGVPQEFAHQDAFAVATKARFPNARVLEYRITDAVPYDAIVHDAIVLHPEYFVRWSNGTVCQMPYEEHGTEDQNCSWPIRASAYDWSQDVVRDWFLTNIIAPTLRVADGAWLDGDGPDNGAWMCSGSYDYYPTNKLPAPYPPINDSAIDAFCAGEALVAAAAQRYLIAHGGFEYNCFQFIDGRDGHDLPNATDTPAVCASKLRALDHRVPAEGAIVYGSDRTGSIHYDLNTSSAQMVASFLLVRDAHWYFGLPSANSFREDVGALYLTNYGAPRENMSSDASGLVFTREYEGALVSLDCNTWAATFTPTRATPSAAHSTSSLHPDVPPSPNLAGVSPETNWIAGQHGIFTHYLYSLQNDFGRNSLGKNSTWSACVDEFDVTAYADSVQAAGARYAVITMMQGSRYLLGPNAAYDAFTGYSPGDACSQRDLVLDLSDALATRNISLMLYWTGDGPHEDAQASAGLGWPDAPRDRSHVPLLFAQRWAAVLEVYARRYAGRVSGWWVDGCYTYFGYNETSLQPYHDAIRAGNPNGLVALNHGVMHPISRYSVWEDYTCGESNDFTEVPASRFVNGSQWHTLSFLGAEWAQAGIRYPAPALGAYIKAVNAVGGAVTVDVQLFRNGSINAQQIAVLAAANAAAPPSLAVDAPLAPPLSYRAFPLATGVTLNALVGGAPLGSGAPTLLFLHGFPEGSWSWSPLLLTHALDAYSFVAPDLRGYNGSSIPTAVDDFALPLLVADVVALISLLAPRVHLVAHDWGGGVAWALASTRADLLLSLTIINMAMPRGWIDEVRHNATQQAASSYVLSFVNPAFTATALANDCALLRGIFAGEAWWTPEMEDAFMHSWHTPGSVNAGLNYYRANIHPACPLSCTQPSCWEQGVTSTFDDIPRTTPATLRVRVLWGLRDTAFDDGGQLAIIRANVRGSLNITTFSDHGHWLAQEAPGPCAAAIAEFVGA